MSRVISGKVCAFILGLVVGATARPASASLLATGQTRALSASVNHSGGTLFEGQTAPDFAPFDAQVSADYSPSPGAGHYVSEAHQESSIDSSGIRANGGLLLSVPFLVTENVQINNLSILSVAFSIAQPVEFNLTGHFQGFWDIGGTNINNGSYLFELSGPGGIMLSLQDVTPAISSRLNRPFALAGTFAPGDYFLDLLVNDSLNANGSPGDPGFGGGGQINYSMELSLAPEPATAVYAALLLAVPPLRRRRMR